MSVLIDALNVTGIPRSHSWFCWYSVIVLYEYNPLTQNNFKEQGIQPGGKIINFVLDMTNASWFGPTELAVCFSAVSKLFCGTLQKYSI